MDGLSVNGMGMASTLAFRLKGCGLSVKGKFAALVPSAPLTGGSTCADVASRPTSNSMDWSSRGAPPGTPGGLPSVAALVSPDAEVQIDAVALADLFDHPLVG